MLISEEDEHFGWRNICCVCYMGRKERRKRRENIVGAKYYQKMIN
jgi:hypothetical protein